MYGKIHSKGGVEMNYQLVDSEGPTLASQDQLRVSLKGLPFVISLIIFHHEMVQTKSVIRSHIQ